MLRYSSSLQTSLISVDAFSVQQHFLIIRVDFSVGIREGTLPRLGCRVAADSGMCIPHWFSWSLFRCHELEELFSVTSWAVENKGHLSKANYSSLSQFAKLIWGYALTVRGLLLSFIHLSDFPCLAGKYIQSHTNSVLLLVPGWLVTPAQRNIQHHLLWSCPLGIGC